MLYYVICRKCKRKNYLLLKNNMYKNRKELKCEIGKSFYLDCGFCGEKNDYVISDVFAKGSKVRKNGEPKKPTTNLYRGRSRYCERISCIRTIVKAYKKNVRV